MIQVEKKATFQCTCGNCLSVLRYEFSDIRRITYKDISQCTEVEDIITCPVCNTQVTVYPKRQ